MAEKLRKQTIKQEHQINIESLRDLSLQLNSLTQDLNHTIQAVEHFLGVTCSLGIPTSVLVKADSSVGYATYLEYRRVGTKFRIAVVEVADQGEIDVRPWSDCPRDEKLETFGKLPELLVRLTETIQERIKQAQAASQSVKPILESLMLERSGSGDDIPF